MADQSSDAVPSEVIEFLHETLDLARSGATAQLQERIDRGVPANLTSASGDTLLILAAYHDHPDTVAMLLQHGAEPDRANDRGQTALGAAVFRRSTAAVQMLTAAGADPAAGARSAFDVAEFFKLDDMTALLRDRGGSSGDKSEGGPVG